MIQCPLLSTQDFNFLIVVKQFSVLTSFLLFSVGGKPRVVTTVTVQLSGDRRVVDEAMAAQFLEVFRGYLATRSQCSCKNDESTYSTYFFRRCMNVPHLTHTHMLVI